jgi:hypothetical protein
MARKQTSQIPRIVVVVDGDKDYDSLCHAKETLLHHLEADVNLFEALEGTFEDWCEGMGFKVVTADAMRAMPAAVGSTPVSPRVVITLPEDDYSRFLKISETAWRKHIDDEAVDFAAAIDDGIEEGLEFAGVAVYSEDDSPIRPKEAQPAPEVEKPAPKQRFVGNRAPAAATAKTKQAAKPKDKPAKGVAAPAAALNGGKGHVNGLANGAAAH